MASNCSYSSLAFFCAEICIDVQYITFSFHLVILFLQLGDLMKLILGSWYSFSPEVAWKWYEDVEAIDKEPTINRRLYQNHGAKYQLYYFDVKPYLWSRHMRQFQEEITKSTLNSQVAVKPSVGEF